MSDFQPSTKVLSYFSASEMYTAQILAAADSSRSDTQNEQPQRHGECRGITDRVAHEHRRDSCWY